MTRKVDAFGRIVLPVEMRSRLHIEKEGTVNINCADDIIIITSEKLTCVICHLIKNKHFPVEQEFICSECIKKMKSL